MQRTTNQITTDQYVFKHRVGWVYVEEVSRLTDIHVVLHGREVRSGELVMITGDDRRIWHVRDTNPFQDSK